jgi:hypothetical protein
LLVEPWAGLQLPRQSLNAKDVPLLEPLDPLFLLCVVRLNAKRDKALPHTLELIRVLRPHCFSKGIPDLLEIDYQLLRWNVPLTRIARYSLHQIFELGERFLRLLQLSSEHRSKLLTRAFRK